MSALNWIAVGMLMTVTPASPLPPPGGSVGASATTTPMGDALPEPEQDYLGMAGAATTSLLCPDFVTDCPCADEVDCMELGVDLVNNSMLVQQEADNLGYESVAEMIAASPDVDAFLELVAYTAVTEDHFKQVLFGGTALSLDQIGGLADAFDKALGPQFSAGPPVGEDDGADDGEEAGRSWSVCRDPETDAGSMFGSCGLPRGQSAGGTLSSVSMVATTTVDPWTPDPMLLSAAAVSAGAMHQEWALSEGCRDLIFKDQPDSAGIVGAVPIVFEGFKAAGIALAKALGAGVAVGKGINEADEYAEDLGVDLYGNANDPGAPPDGFIPNADHQKTTGATAVAKSQATWTGEEVKVSVTVCSGKACGVGGPTMEQMKAAQAQAQASADMSAARKDIKAIKRSLVWMTRPADIKKAKAALTEAKTKLAAAKQAKAKADQDREEADADAQGGTGAGATSDEDEADSSEAPMNIGPEAVDINDCAMAAARALIECLAPAATSGASATGGMTCEAMAYEAVDDLAPEVLTMEVNGGSCSCDTAASEGATEIQGQMALLQQHGGTVDPSPED